MAEADDMFCVSNEMEEDEWKTTPPLSSPRLVIPRRLHALVDIGDFFLGFTIEEVNGAHAARARLFSLHTLSWLEVAVPIRPSEENGEELPIDGQWLMQLIEYETILCIYSNPSRCRLIYLHLDRTATENFPLSLFVRRSRDIRPVLPILADRAIHCSVLYEYERKDEVERVSVVSDDYQFDRDSVRVHEMDGNGPMMHIGACNLTDTTGNALMARCSKGNILLTNVHGKGIFFDRETGEEKIVDIGVNGSGKFPSFKNASFFIVNGRSHAMDSSGFLWSLDATKLEWRKHHMGHHLCHGKTSSLTISPNGRLLCVQHFKHQKGDNACVVALASWRMLQPASLKELALTNLCGALQMDDEETDLVHNGMEMLRRIYDTNIAYLLALTERSTRARQ